MNMSVSPNTQAILLLTAPLIIGQRDSSVDLLKPGEYKRLARSLREMQKQPADLLAPDARELLREVQHFIDSDRLQRLLARGFLLSQAIERWQTRTIWVASRADSEYPKRFRTRLKEDAPPILYGCGEAAILDTSGLAVVGSRNVDDALIAYTEEIGRLTAKAQHTLVSGGARGIDQAAMRGALEAGGKVVGVLADSLERAALNREHRNFLMDGQIVMVSPYDPAAGFNVGNAMQRNKLIYALADAALVVSSDYEKGGTWAGAVEQLEKLRLVPVYVRSNGQTGDGLEALRRKGALPWPNPETPDALAEVLEVEMSPTERLPGQNDLISSAVDEIEPVEENPQSVLPINGSPPPLPLESSLTPADELFAKVRELLVKMKTPKTDAEVAADLQVSKSQAKEWLQRLVDEGVIEKYTKPVRYGPKSQSSFLE
ncbi:MAG: DNA-processing protein DprA [Acidobacteria bacterium]|nr:DNA-processing protein DprA [Acidobacteriota bacterium]